MIEDKIVQKIVVTNNPKVLENIENKNIKISYYQDYSYIDILYKVRDLVHLGYSLLTHPIVSSIKPYETPYKTIVLCESNSNLDIDSLYLIENAISLSLNFLDKPVRKLTPSIDEDFKLIDYKLVFDSIENIL